MRPSVCLLALLGAALLVGPGCSDGGGRCELSDPRTCGSGQVCEEVEGSEPRCFEPVLVLGHVRALETPERGIAGAHVAALGPGGEPLTPITASSTDGNYGLRIPSVRTDASGTLRPQAFTLRISAPDHAPFPGLGRESPTLDTGNAAPEGSRGGHTLRGASTEVGLLLLPEAERGRPSIIGQVDLSGLSRTALVVAESSGRGYATLADRDGMFRIFNVPQGRYDVTAYARDARFLEVTTDVEATGVQDVLLPRLEAPLATVLGTVSLPVGTLAAEVWLVVASTWSSAFDTGEPPPGLGFDVAGPAENPSGGFQLPGVADGRYLLVPAARADGQVRDPATGTPGGTPLEVRDGKADGAPTLGLTSAISIEGPGAGGEVDALSGPPTFTWSPYPGSASYTLRLFDAGGAERWSREGILATAQLPQRYTYDGPALEPGRVFHWRVVATGPSPADEALASSEPELGRFRFQ